MHVLETSSYHPKNCLHTVYIHVKDVQQPLAIVWKMEIGCFWYHWHKSENIFCVNKACLKVAQSLPMSEDTSIQYALELAV